MSSFWSVVAASSLLAAINVLLLLWELRVSRRRGRAIATRGWIASNLGSRSIECSRGCAR